MDTRDHAAWKRLLADVPLPAALVDLDAMARNARAMLERLAPGVALRVATKSLRCVPLVHRALALAGARARGVMTYSARETRWLAERHGLTDLVLAYPAARPDEARALVAAARLPGVRVRALVDDPAHVALLAAAVAEAGGAAGLTLGVDLDAAWRPLGALGGDRVHLGVRRSPVRDGATAVALADRARASGLVVDAVMAYEAQVAGLADESRESAWLDPVRRLVRRRSQPFVAARRREVVAALRAAGHPIALVNGGGTGSVGETSADGTVTEVTVGSGFLAPHLFDGYRALPLEPAAFFALAVARTPDRGFVTCFSGGFIASGASGADRLPRVHCPDGLAPTTAEGFGEVQTPLVVSAGAPRLAIGDPVVCRHGKAGELFERFASCYLVADARVDGVAQTYRGEGEAFG